MYLSLTGFQVVHVTCSYKIVPVWKDHLEFIVQRDFYKSSVAVTAVISYHHVAVLFLLLLLECFLHLGSLQTSIPL